MGLVVFAAPAVAQDFKLVTTLSHANQREFNDDRFGSAVAISGGTLLIGAKSELGANDYSGIVHVFSGEDWSEVARLESSEASDFEFGAAIRLDGDRALISNMAIDAGVVWFFEKVAGVWTEKSRVQGVVNEAFGYRLALHGDFAFIGVPRVGTGNVRVYRRVLGTWSEVQVLTASDAMAEDFFGYSIAFDGTRLVVAAPGNGLGPKRSGVYTFSRVGEEFVEDGKIAGDDPATRWFGAKVAVSRDTLIVNAPPVYPISYGGKALVYGRRGEQWELERELTVEEEASFPTELDFDEETVWLGARTSEPRAMNYYAFRRTNGDWGAPQKLSFPAQDQHELTSSDFRDGTFLVGFWNGLRNESVQIYREPGHGSSSGGAPPNGGVGEPSAGAGAESGNGAAEWGSNAGRTSGGRAGTAGVGGDTSTSGGIASESAGESAGPSAAGPSSGGGSSTESTSAGHAAVSNSSRGSGCAVRSVSDARAWPFAVLALAVAFAGRMRATTRPRSHSGSCRRGRAGQSAF